MGTSTMTATTTSAVTTTTMTTTTTTTTTMTTTTTTTTTTKLPTAQWIPEALEDEAEEFVDSSGPGGFQVFALIIAIGGILIVWCCFCGGSKNLRQKKINLLTLWK